MPLQFAKIVLAALLVSPAAMAASVKADPIAAHGCLSRVSVADAEAAITRFNLKTANATPREIQTLGTALTWIEKLNDGRPLARAIAATGYSYNFQDATRNSHQAPGEIRVNRNGPKKYGENAAQLVHELGHLIGNSDETGKPNPDQNIYIDYINFVGPRSYCMVSTYADDNSHEQFAEVFAAFVTRPALLKRDPSPACKKAYEFLSTKLFAPTSSAVAQRCMTHQLAMENRLNASADTAPGATNSSRPANGVK